MIISFSGFKRLTCFIVFCICAGSPAYSAPDSRVVGGSPTQTDWPWMSAMVYSGEQSISSGFVCGCEIIHKSWAITAAHCVTYASGEKETQLLEPADIHVIPGIRDLKTDSGIRIPVKEVIRHPGYQKDDYWDADIALLHLDQPLFPGDSGETIGLPPYDYVAEQKRATLLGWGATDREGRVYPELLHEVELPVISNYECNLAFNQLPYYSDPVSGNMICAGSEGKDACYDDSGGPLFISENQKNFLIGIVSWGDSCARPGLYGVYTRVTAFLDFIYAYVPELNLVPVPMGDSYHYIKGKPLLVEAPGVLGNDTDPERGVIKAVLLDPPPHGELVLSPDGAFTYYPESNAETDRFTYMVQDGYNNSKMTEVFLLGRDEVHNEPETGTGDNCFLQTIPFLNSK